MLVHVLDKIHKNSLIALLKHTQLVEIVEMVPLAQASVVSFVVCPQQQKLEHCSEPSGRSACCQQDTTLCIDDDSMLCRASGHAAK
jgi:hypothetical protein